MDTKLKNRHKLALLIMILTVMIPALVIVLNYQTAGSQMLGMRKDYERETLVSEEFMENFVEASYILYNTEKNSKQSSKQAETVENFLNNFFYEGYDEVNLDDFMGRLEYQVLDNEKNLVLDETAKTTDPAKIHLVLTYDQYGDPTVVVDQGASKEEQTVALRKCIAAGLENTELGYAVDDFDGSVVLNTPKNRTYEFSMSQENLEEYVEDFSVSMYSGAYEDTPEWLINLLLFCMLIVAAVALFLPFIPTLHTGDENLFLVPFEFPLIAGICTIAASVEGIGALIMAMIGNANTLNYRLCLNYLLWCVVFSVIYWCSACLRHVFSMGPKAYFLQCSLTVSALRWMKRVGKSMVKKCKEWLDKLYHSFDEIDFSDNNNKTILKIVLINFAILVVITCMWFVGVAALIIYSVILFIILRKYFNDLRDKYDHILHATNEMANGNLNVEFDEDLGVFHSFAQELSNIQDGYQKAVEKEVKSQKMKTELVTNVSHDLKTPLTAIITYVNLLKEETDEDKRKEYIDVLERKSMRLKALIEDLFEISKASSKDVTLNLAEVDVVSLFKQVQFELKEKCDAAKLDFRCSFPEEKLIAELDGQKTYRIFENLLVNVTKYAMENTRVYVKVEKEESQAVLTVLNISANELTVGAEELTERFVRGDISRNTEGSGLGLAIAKSFTELQKGSFQIEIEGDLFKVKVAFPLKKQ